MSEYKGLNSMASEIKPPIAVKVVKMMGRFTFSFEITLHI